ncbi:MAG: carbamoyl phosphate synthase small subunit [Clostridia bacterium]|nr:carbamoyl phosphate synthase small subunit [Clostridia bacterium]
MENAKVYLTLQNGKTFVGQRIGASGDVIGELVFTTGVVGYVETLTDPNYCGQTVVQTFPLIGNYGVMPEDAESRKSWVSAYIVREICDEPSNFRCKGKLNDYLKENGIVGICGIDTRELTKIIREVGVMPAAITSKPLKDLEKLSSYKIENAVNKVTCQEVEYYGNPENAKVVVWDMGVKNSVINALVNKNLYVIKVPAFYTAEQIAQLNPQGLVVSNGPGNPAENVDVIAELKKLMGKLPVLGIGLGHQLVALAVGGKTQKMKHGHRGGNQPVKCLKCGKVFLTNQNHGYEVVTSSVENLGEVRFANVNDGSCEGVFYHDLNAITVQFYPTACGGGRDTTFIYDKFIEKIKEVK